MSEGEFKKIEKINILFINLQHTGWFISQLTIFFKRRRGGQQATTLSVYIISHVVSL